MRTQLDIYDFISYIHDMTRTRIQTINHAGKQLCWDGPMSEYKGDIVDKAEYINWVSLIKNHHVNQFSKQLNSSDCRMLCDCRMLSHIRHRYSPRWPTINAASKTTGTPCYYMYNYCLGRANLAYSIHHSYAKQSNFIRSMSCHNVSSIFCYHYTVQINTY